MGRARVERRVGAGLTAILAVLLSCIVLPLTPAAAAPGFVLDKSAPATVRAGEPITYTLRATNPSSNPDAVNEWNLSLRDALPPGVTYVPGSTDPTRFGEPEVATSGSSTVLTWTSVADLTVNSSVTLTFQALPDPDNYPVGTPVPNQATAYASDDPFLSPEFDETGAVRPDSFTETAADAATTTTSAVDISKSEPSPEGELLRGVHDHPTVYALTVRAADAGGSSGLVVTDYLPRAAGVPRVRW